MSTPQSTPVRQVKLGIVSAKSLPLTNEYKRLLGDQHQRLSLKHQQDLDLLDDIRSYVKTRLAIEKDYTNALQKLAKQHSNHISKKFSLLAQLEPTTATTTTSNEQQNSNENNSKEQQNSSETTTTTSLYKVWSEHITRLATTSRQRSDQFEQLNLIIDKLKDIRSHKASIGKKCLDTHLKRIQEELLVSMLDVEKAKKLYYEDESQAKKARETEERYKKKRTGLLTKFTDLQAKKEKSSAQREATDIQSTQARNDYIMALAAANAHLKYYYKRDLNDFIHLIDDGVLDHCKLFMATLSECDINSLKDSLSAAQSWSRLINLSGSQQTNYIFLECEQSKCLRTKQELAFEPCNADPISRISLEHNADYALQHEIDKWFTWFKKECRNLSQLMHQLDTCQHALAEGKKSIELNGQTIEELEPKVLELKQQLRKCEAAKLKAQARLQVIQEGGMQIEEWEDVETEIRADMARAQEEQQRLKEAAAAAAVANTTTTSKSSLDLAAAAAAANQREPPIDGQAVKAAVQLQVSHDSMDSEGAADESHNLASVSRSTSNLLQKQQNAMTGYSALTDPSLVWQDDYSNAASAWGQQPAQPQIASSSSFIDQQQQQQQPTTSVMSPTSPRPTFEDSVQQANSSGGGGGDKQQMAPGHAVAMASIQSSSPLSAIVNGGQHLSQSPYQGILQEAYKSDYECDYTRTGAHPTLRSAASSADQPQRQQEAAEITQEGGGEEEEEEDPHEDDAQVEQLLHKRVVALYTFEKSNDDDLAFCEGDLLYVLEVNPQDPDWMKAQSESSGAQGFIPSSYVRLCEQQQQQDETQQEYSGQAAWPDEMAPDGDGETEVFCKALYDYTPEANTFDEQDGLAHLALCQGELMRVLDQGQDDGWWLVEKQDEQRTRGHVPSMLVDELTELVQAEGDEQDEEEEEEDDEDDGEVSDRDELAASSAPPPSFEAPVLAPPPPEAEVGAAGNGNSLVPTSFIIIEPTPEVETKRFEDNLEKEEESSAGTEGEEANAQQREETTNEDDDDDDDDEGKRRIEQQLPSSQVSYSVVNEEFVLEKPTRKPNQVSRSSIDSSTTTPSHQPTIEEEEDDDEVDCKLPPPPPPLDTNDDQMPVPIMAPPEVVIDVVEAIPRSPDLSFDEDDGTSGDNQGGRESANSRTSDTTGGGGDESTSCQHDVDSEAPERKPIKHSGFVDVSPILRHHAEEFCKQLIEEAIMLAPGSRIGPSTSSASVNDAQGDDQYDDDHEQNGSFEEST